jgi:acetoin utilization deacetylase AcuC-like enzyme
MKIRKHPIICHSSYNIPLPERHRFPGTKYSLLLQHLEDIGLTQNFLKYTPKPCTAENLSIAHKASYIKEIQTGNLSKESQTRLGLPWSEYSENVHLSHPMEHYWLHSLRCKLE